MPRPICREDFFDYHATRILSEAMRGHELGGTATNKADWLWENAAEVGKAFLDNLEQWSGVEQAIEEIEADDK